MTNLYGRNCDPWADKEKMVLNSIKDSARLGRIIASGRIASSLVKNPPEGRRTLLQGLEKKSLRHFFSNVQHSQLREKDSWRQYER